MHYINNIFLSGVQLRNRNDNDDNNAIGENFVEKFFYGEKW